MGSSQSSDSSAADSSSSSSRTVHVSFVEDDKTISNTNEAKNVPSAVDTKNVDSLAQDNRIPEDEVCEWNKPFYLDLRPYHVNIIRDSKERMISDGKERIMARGSEHRRHALQDIEERKLWKLEARRAVRKVMQKIGACPQDGSSRRLMQEQLLMSLQNRTAQ